MPKRSLVLAGGSLKVAFQAGVLQVGGENTAVIIGRGIIRLGLFDFLQQLTTFRIQGPTPAASFEALTRFGILFMGKLWDVYGRQFAGPATIG
jgi:hypothetical protein